MDFFEYKDNQLYCEETPISAIAAEVGTPVYIYSAATLKRHLLMYQEAFAEFDPLICYSVKGCGNINILKLTAQLQSGFDVVSGGELFRVQQAGGDLSKVVYAGAGKTDAEIVQAIEAQIAYFNIESEAEIENLISLAGRLKKQVRCALRINPDVDPKTHRHTTTGKKETKFGVDLERAMNVFETYGRDEYVKLTGVHIHIGSPVNSPAPYVEAVTKTVAFIDELRKKGFAIEALDIGGGFGADYTADQAPQTHVYAEAIAPLLRGKDLKLILEPGRSISANAGIMVARVIYTKTGGKKNFAIIDGAMNDLIRPMLYGAFHFIWPVKPPSGFELSDRVKTAQMAGLVKTDVVGPICETGDFMAKDRDLPPVERDDLIAIFSAGAYGFVMSSQYNSRPRAAEVLVDGDSWQVIRRRESYEDLVAAERI